jgi:hypothetical protein
MYTYVYIYIYIHIYIYKGVAKRVSQGEGPFLIEFVDSYKEKIYFQIDGENYACINPKEFEVHTYIYLYTYVCIYTYRKIHVLTSDMSVYYIYNSYAYTYKHIYIYI